MPLPFRPDVADQLLALHKFLQSAYTPDELRRLLSLSFGNEGRSIVQNVNFNGPAARVFEEVVELLGRLHVYTPLWNLFWADRKHRRADVAELERAFMWHAVPPDKRIKVLLVTANVDPTAPLNLPAELEKIRIAVATAPHGAQFEFVVRDSVSWDDFRDAVLEVRPHVVQFSGHADASGTFVFRGTTRAADRSVPLAMFMGLLTEESRGVGFVLLNACYSQVAAQQLTRGLDYVIGMNGTIADDAAARFASIFYRTLAQGSAVPDAFSVARNEMHPFEQELVPRIAPERK